MFECHHIAGPPRGEPLPVGRVGARVRVPLTGTPSPQWSTLMAGRLAAGLQGHHAIGHLKLARLVQGAEIVLEGVEAPEAEALGPALRDAVEAANRAMARDGGERPPGNMAQADADEIARGVQRGAERVSWRATDAPPAEPSDLALAG